MRRITRALPLLLLTLTLGCPGELPREDGRSSPTADRPLPTADRPPPDRQRAEPQLFQPDSYQSQPFGCARDSDCFGKRCCPTPWGVKLCAPVCQF